MCMLIRERLTQFMKLPLPQPALRFIMGFACPAFLLGSQANAQQPIPWSSSPHATNLTSDGSEMDGNFRFELGVFNDGFIPTAENTADWSANWNSAQYTFYDPETKSFAALHQVIHNNAPFTSGKATYVWGFNGTPQSAEWILFTHPSWTRPNSISNPGPGLTPWQAKGAHAIVGQIEKSGGPFLMRSAAVSQAAPPATSWETWQARHLEKTSSKGVTEDSDKDGAANLLEFVMGSDPLNGGGIPSSKVDIIPADNQKYLQITIPRRVDHKAVLTVEVASHPAGPWFSGPAHTTTISDTLDSLVVRDNTPLGKDNPHRFIQLKAELASP